MRVSKDKVYNFLLNITYRIKRFFIKKPKSFKPRLDLQIHDIFEDVDKLWDRHMWWGNYADDEDTTYQDSECVIPLGGGEGVKLTTEFKPKLNKKNNKIMSFAHGVLHCKQTFYTGAIEVVVNIRPASSIWHAPLWFVTKDDVLPEIDVSEVYTEYDKDEGRSNSNLHFGTDYGDNSKSLGANTHYLPELFNRDISFAMKWNKRRISIYYDGYLVRKITNKRILRRIQKGIVPIINVNLSPDYIHTSSEMIVKSFKYWK
jgi:hypothetical protein